MSGLQINLLDVYVCTRGGHVGGDRQANCGDMSSAMEGTWQGQRMCAVEGAVGTLR